MVCGDGDFDIFHTVSPRPQISAAGNIPTPLRTSGARISGPCIKNKLVGI